MNYLIKSLFIILNVSFVVGLNEEIIITINNNKLSPFVSNNDKVKFLFNVFDNNPHDDYFGYSELKLFQHLTYPLLELDISIYKYIINLLGGNFNNGLTISVFNSSYYQYKHVLGTDLDRDFNIIYNMLTMQLKKS